ncbi:hypothetical protein H6F50_08615 [Coleofasciculus sp. FACHB-712]|uniref:hypothetical protein n=1 Tax=Coleofasciculus sp. FACHB-712 TaxID=2692789 RepID=UPI00168794C7|nr:hypothetical protein [Coleofasciculus sp. FACHB-712]MBD1942418.1 hypothetical protein [Coleofasciculus sp. FACHB-712]
MIFKIKQPRKIFIFSILGLGLAVGAYYGWFFLRDYQTLRQVQADQKKIAAYRQKTQAMPTDPQAFLNLGNAYMTFWESSGKGIRIASQLQQQSLAWEWLFTKPKMLSEAVLAYKCLCKINYT